MLRRAALGAAAVTAGATAFQMRRNRPLASFESEAHAAAARHRAKRRVEDENAFHLLGRASMQLLVAGISKFVVSVQNRVEVEGADKLRRAITAREKGVPLLTVCNHQSVLDDPAVFAGVLPLRITANPLLMRWGLCAEEYCFGTPATASMFGAGKVFPIKRGRGIFQPALAPMLTKLDQGEWVHLFPEARIWQEVGTPTRDSDGLFASSTGRRVPGAPPGTKLGPLKWGVGRLIADAERTPMVLPFFHLGMDRLMPQDANNDLTTSWPTWGNTVRLRVGDPVDVADLVDEYREGLKQMPPGPERHRFKLDMYRRITERVEAAMLAVELGMRADFPEMYDHVRLPSPSEPAGAPAPGDVPAKEPRTRPIPRLPDVEVLLSEAKHRLPELDGLVKEAQEVPPRLRSYADELVKEAQEVPPRLRSYADELVKEAQEVKRAASDAAERVVETVRESAEAAEHAAVDVVEAVVVAAEAGEAGRGAASIQR